MGVLCLFALFCLEHYNPSGSVLEVKLRNIYFQNLKVYLITKFNFIFKIKSKVK